MNRVSYQPSLLDGLSSLPAQQHHAGAATSVLQAIWRHKLFVLAAVGLGLALSVGAMVVLKKTYVGEAVLQLDLTRRDGSLSPEPATSVALDGATVVQSEARIIRSHTIARRVVGRLSLAEQAKPGWTVWSLLPEALREVIAPGRTQDGVDAAELATRTLMANLIVESDNRSYLITIRATANQPGQAAQIANAVASEYIERRLEVSIDAANVRVAWLGQQIETVTAQLRAADQAVAEQRDKTGLIEFSGDGGRLDQQQIREIAAQLSTATLARITEEGRLARVQALQRSGMVLSSVDLQGFPAVQQLVQRESTARRESAELQSRFGPRYPTVVQAQRNLAEISDALAKQVDRTVSAMETSAESIRLIERSLKNRLDMLQQSMMLGRGGETDYRERVASAQSIRDRLVSLTRSHEQALAQSELRTVAATVIVNAEPTRIPASPKPLVVLALGLFAGLGAGFAGANLLERGDYGLRTSAEVLEKTGYRCLGMLPEVDGAGQHAGKDQAVFDEAVRSVGAGIGVFGATRECQIVVVTSSVLDEGASTLCRALSRSLVAAGQRVLLIDGAPNRPFMPGDTSGFRADDDSQQLATLSSDMLAVVQRSSAVAISADVFGSGKFGRVLDQARKHFDVILIEAPPVLLVADALVLGRMADRVVLVARAARTRRAVIQAALARLQESSVVVEGLVLARVNLRRRVQGSLADHCAYYLRERRYYEHLAAPAKPTKSDVARAS